MRFTYTFFIAIVLAMIVYSCREKGNKNLDQGEIHYNIDYVGDFFVPKEFLPKSLVLSFKNDKILFEMTGMANSGIINLSNPEKGIFDTYFSVPPLKIYYAGKKNEIYPGFEAMDGMKITRTEKTAVICGLNCKNAEVIFPDDQNKIINIWYTDEINVKNPNQSSPFKEIEGVLMSFFFYMGKTELHFNAESVYRKDISNETFERREKYTRVTKEDIIRLMNKMGS